VRPSLTFWIGLAALGSLAGLLVLPTNCHSDQARVTAAAYDVRHGLKAALDSYRADLGVYPGDLGALVQDKSGNTNWHGPYLDPAKLPVDPWGNPYVYHFPGKRQLGSYDLLSAGPDGKEGTGDDVDSWP
jgi:general secretion pathway protein G